MKLSQAERLDYLRTLGLSKFRRATVLIPLEVSKAMEFLYLFMYKNGTSYHFLIDIITSFGIMTFFELITEYKVTSFFQVMKLLKLQRKSMRAFVEAAKEVEPLITLSNFRWFVREMKRKNLNAEQQSEFMEYLIDNNKTLVGEKIILDTKDFECILNNWILRKVKVKEI